MYDVWATFCIGCGRQEVQRARQLAPINRARCEDCGTRLPVRFGRRFRDGSIDFGTHRSTPVVIGVTRVDGSRVEGRMDAEYERELARQDRSQLQQLDYEREEFERLFPYAA